MELFASPTAKIAFTMQPVEGTMLSGSMMSRKERLAKKWKSGILQAIKTESTAPNSSMKIYSLLEVGIRTWLFGTVEKRDPLVSFTVLTSEGTLSTIKNKQLLIGSYAKEKNLQLFDLGSRKLIRNIKLEKQNPKEDYFVYVSKFAPSEDETIVVGTAGVNEIQIYDLKGGNDEMIGLVQNKPGGLYSVDFA